MAESSDEREKRILRELEGKNIAHYQVLLSAWIATRMERDKTIITLSSVAMGLLVTILTAVGISGLWQYLFAFLSLIGFIVAIALCLHIYQFNAKHLEETLRETDETDTSRLLKNLDKWSSIFFYAGIVCAILMATFISVQKTGEAKMANNEKSKVKAPIQGSFNGVKKLSPADVRQNSLSGISNLSPQNLQSSTPNSPKNDGNVPSGSDASGNKNDGAKEGRK